MFSSFHGFRLDSSAVIQSEGGSYTPTTRWRRYYVRVIAKLQNTIETWRHSAATETVKNVKTQLRRHGLMCTLHSTLAKRHNRGKWGNCPVLRVSVIDTSLRPHSPLSRSARPCWWTTAFPVERSSSCSRIPALGTSRWAALQQFCFCLKQLCFCLHKNQRASVLSASAHQNFTRQS